MKFLKESNNIKPDIYIATLVADFCEDCDSHDVIEDVAYIYACKNNTFKIYNIYNKLVGSCDRFDDCENIFWSSLSKFNIDDTDDVEHVDFEVYNGDYDLEDLLDTSDYCDYKTIYDYFAKEYPDEL